MSGTHSEGFSPKQHPMSVMCPQQAGFVQLQYTETTCCSSRADTHTLTVYKYRLLFLMWYPQCLIQTQYVISPVLIEAEVKLVFGQDLFCWFSPTRHLGDRVGSWMMWATNLNPHWKAPHCNFVVGVTCTRNRRGSKSARMLVCFQEVSQLATEEVSIFRPMRPADRLSSSVITRQAARLRVKSLRVSVRRKS